MWHVWEKVVVVVNLFVYIYIYIYIYIYTLLTVSCTYYTVKAGFNMML